ncbi:protein AATF [Lingula anatina]|uniref:Protein AATF n=1 Tax=Lingula anatina TaxID=7574 RepID=A0A1S3JWN2_LINAN|nr:protein AATF [Lingula anatina]|eukprot:XP_013414471.1 protein AATF [Lingula anatina]
MASLAEQIAQLANPAPSFKDPEDDIDDDTSAKVVNSYVPSDLCETNETSLLRKKVTPLLSDTDVRYAGRSVSRKNLLGASTESDNEEEFLSEEEGSLESSDEDREDSDLEDIDLETFKNKLTDKTAGKRQINGNTEHSDDYEDGSDAMSDDDDDDDDVEGEETEEDELLKDQSANQQEDDIEEEKGDVQSLFKSDVAEEKEKGLATRAQLTMWDSLLEGRIKLQKALILANQLPQPNTWPAFSKEENYLEATTEVESVLSQLENALAELQTLLLQQNPEVKHLVDNGQQKLPNSAQDSEDEEITSESEFEDDEKNAKKTSKSPDLSHKRKITVDEFPEFLAKRHKAFHLYRNNTIQKWNDKTKLAAGKVSSKSFSAFDQSTLKQIEQVLSDRERLLRRTQLKRSSYRVLGKEKEDEDRTEAHEQLPNRDHLKDYDEEIFDDDDFYHQLLRELIERKTSDLTDPVAITRQWLEIQKLRSKSKKKVDTKASKGRKIRYNILNKLVNFMAPQDTTTWTDESKDDLYSSLFGKRFQGVADNQANKS